MAGGKAMAEKKLSATMNKNPVHLMAPSWFASSRCIQHSTPSLIGFSKQFPSLSVSSGISDFWYHFATGEVGAKENLSTTILH